MWKLIVSINIFMIVYLFGVRNATAYYKESYIKKFIKIKNPVIANILISKRFTAIGKDTDIEDRNKMSITGVISYIYMIISSGPFIYANIFLEMPLTRLFYCFFFINLPVSSILFFLNNFSVLKNENNYRRNKLDKIGKGLEVLGLVLMLLILIFYSIYLVISIQEILIQFI